MNMLTTVKKWGNSASVRIPVSIMESIKLSVNQKADIREENGRIIIEPVREDCDLESLLSLITAENLHTEANFGEPAGKESF